MEKHEELLLAILKETDSVVNSIHLVTINLKIEGARIDRANAIAPIVDELERNMQKLKTDIHASIEEYIKNNKEYCDGH